ncbi:MAG: class II fructose-bisphosphatase, partial [Fusobacterium sp.]
RGDKNLADDAAVQAMRNVLNRVKIDGEIVIGEGEIDEAPMLYIGEKVGLKYNSKKIEDFREEDLEPVDIAVDPIEGTRMTAQGQPNAIVVLAAAKKGHFLKAPDMYMEKIVVGPEAKGCIDIDDSLENNIRNVAKALGKNVEDLMVAVLEKPRHKKVIERIRDLGAKMYVFPDGDVATSILTCMVDSDVDMMYGIGGAPEGVVSAGVIRALGGDMQAKLVLRSDVKGSDDKNDKISEDENRRCIEAGVEVNKKLTLEELVSTDEIVFSGTGITDGDLITGVKRKGNIARTQTLLVRGSSKTIRYINSIHNLDFKDSHLDEIIK